MRRVGRGEGCAQVAGRLPGCSAPAVPRMDRAIGATEQKLFEKVPAAQFLYREFMYWRAEFTALVDQLWGQADTPVNRVGLGRESADQKADRLTLDQL